MQSSYEINEDMASVQCLYCGEMIDIELDPDLSSESQAFIEDCQVCCRPIEFRLIYEGENARLLVTRDDD